MSVANERMNDQTIL